MVHVATDFLKELIWELVKMIHQCEDADCLLQGC